MTQTTATATAATTLYECNGGTSTVNNSTFNGNTELANAVQVEGCSLAMGANSLIENVGVSGTVSCLYVSSGTAIVSSTTLTPVSGRAITVSGTGVLNCTTCSINADSSAVFAVGIAGGTFTCTSCTGTRGSSASGQYLFELSNGQTTIHSGTFNGNNFAFALFHLETNSPTLTISSATLSNVGTGAALLILNSGTPTVTSSSNIFLPNEGYAIIVVVGSMTSSSDTIVGSSGQIGIKVEGGTLTATSASINTTGANPCVEVTGGQFEGINGVYDGGGFASDTVSCQGGTCILSGTTIQHAGGAKRCILAENAGTTLIVNNSATIQNCGTATAVLVTTAAFATFNSVILGTTNGDGIDFTGSAPNCTVANLSTPAGQTIAKYGVNLTTNCTVLEKTGTNTGIISTDAQVRFASNSVTKTFSQIDTLGSFSSGGTEMIAN
jgi:hypothetical protein